MKSKPKERDFCINLYFVGLFNHKGESRDLRLSIFFAEIPHSKKYPFAKILGLFACLLSSGSFPGMVFVCMRVKYQLFLIAN